MGNCQAIDNATLVVQHPNGRVDKLYCSVTASEIMKMNPGHYVALLLTTTLCHSNSATSTTNSNKTAANNNKKSSSTTTSKDKNNIPVRITRIKLLRPTDTLVLGHVYRLITAQEVMKGLWAKKYAKKKQQADSTEKQERLTAQEIADLEAAIQKYQMEKSNQMEKTNQIEKKNQAKHERSRSRTSPQVNSTAAKSRAWQPKLQSISEAGS